jgi:hypothetical protein
MAQASAFATGSACALRHGSGSVAQTPIRALYSDCTSYSSSDLADATTTSQLDTLIRHGGGLPQQDVATALRELIATMVAMADERSPPSHFRFFLGPDLDKTMMLMHFVQQLLGP